MKQTYLLYAGALATLLGLAGCIDDKYDIGNADYLTRIEIKDLTIPLNLDKIIVDDIVDLTDGTNVEILKDPVSGKEYYALVENGEIESDAIEIDPIDIVKPDVDPSVVTIHQVGASAIKAKKAPAGTVSYNVDAMESTFSYKAFSVDEAVKSIGGLQTVDPVKIEMTIKIPSFLGVESTSVENLRLEFPKGLLNADGTSAKSNVGTYDEKTGFVTIPSYTFKDSHTQTFSVTCEGFNLEEADVEIDETTRELVYSGTMGCAKQGVVHLLPSAGSSLPSSFDLSADYEMQNFSVRNFTGDIDYLVENTDIDPIHLDDLPDFLQDPETEIIMSNPQFYIAVDNATAKYGTKGDGHLAFESQFNNAPDYSSESKLFEIQAKSHTNICLAPDRSKIQVPEEFATDLQFTEYKEMKYILSGEPGPDYKAAGLPSQIQASFVNPRFFGHATKFPVENKRYKEPIGTMKGSYQLLVPLSFDANSVIVYSESADIGGDEMDNVYVRYLTVKANGDSSFPVDLKLSVVAYDMENNVLGRTESPLLIPALSTEPIELTVKSISDEPMRAIDRLDFHATINQEADGAGTSLAPDQGLQLNNLKITVSGYYEKNLKDDDKD